MMKNKNKLTCPACGGKGMRLSVKPLLAFIMKASAPDEIACGLCDGKGFVKAEQ